METLIASLIGAALIPLIALGINSLIAQKLTSAKTEITVTDKEGKSETLLVENGPSEAAVRKRISDAYAFEDKVYAALKELERETGDGWKARKGRKVDYVLESARSKIALEVKLNAERLNANAIKQYLDSEDKPDKLIIVSCTPSSTKYLEKFQMTINRIDGGSRVSLLTIPEGQNPKNLIQGALASLR